MTFYMINYMTNYSCVCHSWLPWLVYSRPGYIHKPVKVNDPSIALIRHGVDSHSVNQLNGDGTKTQADRGGNNKEG